VKTPCLSGDFTKQRGGTETNRVAAFEFPAAAVDTRNPQGPDRDRIHSPPRGFGNLRFRVEIKDTNNARYVIDIAGLGGRVVHETPLVRVRHQRVYHEPIDGNSIGRDYLSSQFYIYEYRDQPFVTVDWILGNDYLGKDDPGESTNPNLFPLGGVDVNDAIVQFTGMTEARPYADAM